MTNATESIADLSKKRDELIRRLLKALEHLSREQQFSILTSFMSLDELRELVKFQERPN